MPYLVVDLIRILDESAPGRRAAEDLAQRWEAARRELERLDARSAQGDEEAAQRAEALAREVPSKLEALRAKSRDELLQRARRVVAEIASERGVSLVMPLEQVLAFDAAADITDETLRRLS